jgi:hypothetical protein
MATLTIDEWFTKLDTRLKEIEEGKQAIACIQGTIANYIPRIFEDGLNSKGSDIGEYSTKRTVINSSQSPKSFANDTFVPFKAAKRQSTGKKGFFGKEFEGGYKQFKGFIGRGTRVNLRLFDELKSDAASAFLVKEADGITYKLKKQINAKKKEWTEAKYGAIFNLTAKEREQYTTCYKNAVLKRLTE